MRTIYEPSGKAREYSPLALNIYLGCDHGCVYCYARDNKRGGAEGPVKARAGLVAALELELQKRVVTQQVLLCFTCDPYPMAPEYHLTHDVLKVLLAHKVPTAILTKGGARCHADLALFKRYGVQGVPLKVGASLTLFDAEASARLEPGAALPDERLATLEMLHEAGVRTWVSFEPVVDPEQTLDLMAAATPWVDEYKIGKLNHDPAAEAAIDWGAFGRRAVLLARKLGKRFYVKEDLRKAMGGRKEVDDVELTAAETDQDALTLRSAECGVRSAEMGNAECGVRNAETEKEGPGGQLSLF